MKTFLKICLLLGVNFNFVYGMATSGPLGPIKFYTIGECEVPINNFGLNFELETQSDKSKSVNMRMEILEDVGDDLEMLLIADKWVNNAWQKETFKVSGNLFEYIDKYVSKVWTSMREQIEPKIENNHMISAGEYKLLFLQVNYKDVDLPQAYYGRFAVEVTISKNGEDFLCFRAELEMCEP